MKITLETPYPTIGEVLLAVFKWSGLWDYLGERSELKSLQKKLQRFSSEETILTNDEIAELICESLRAAVSHKTLGFIAARTFMLLMDGYRQDMRSEATWFDRKQTCQWFFRCRLVMPLVMNLQRAQMIFRPEHDPKYNYHFPEEPFWFLPEKIDGQWVMPLQKVMQWWLAANKFESLEDFSGVSAPTIRNWEKADSKPAVASLIGIEKASLSLPYDEPNMKRSLTLLVMISNLVSGFFDSMCALVGEEQVKDFLSDFRKLYEVLEKNEKREFKGWVAPEIEKGRINGEAVNCPREELMAGEFLALKDWEEMFHTKFLGPRLLDVLSVVQKMKSLDCLQHNNFVCEAAGQIWISQQKVAEECFGSGINQLLYDAMELSELVVSGDPSAWVEVQLRLPAFRTQCKELGGGLDFYPNYLNARLATYAVNYEEALGWYHRAFHTGRYCGGGVMKNCAEECLILGSYLYLNREKFGIKVSKNLLNYLHKWLSLLYPLSKWAKASETEFIEVAVNSFNP